ncbi:MAG: hypothetical protein JXA82_19945 [Sedimentisphaerales bacterium]|nr:hypothetical protein [Sedimentisphaerales bacterium]
MRKTAVVFGWIFLSTCISVFGQGYRYSNPADVSGVVGSSRQPSASRLYSNPTTEINYGNRIVTGDVAGGKQFQGSVPYFSSSRFNTTMQDTGSQSVTSFVRRSAGNPYTSSPIPSQSYYDPRLTVSSFSRGGQSGLQAPQVIPQSRPGDYSLTSPVIPEGEYYRQEPVSTVSAELERIINQQRGIRNIVLEYESLLKDKGDAENDELISQLLDKPRERLFDETMKPVEPDVPAEPPSPDLREQRRIEMMERELLAALLDTEEEPLEPLDVDTLPEPTETRSTEPERKGLTSSIDTTSTRSPLAMDEETRQLLERHARVQEILGDHENFESLAKAKYEGYFAQAQDYLKEGKFYKAADTYTLATIWRSNDVEANFGKAISLFAAGSYLSSYYSLIRTMDLSKERVLEKHDLSVLLGGRDIFEDRLIELEKWQDQSKSPELAFLVAYLFYQDGKIDSAKLALNLAKEKLGQTPGYIALQEALISDGK